MSFSKSNNKVELVIEAKKSGDGFIVTQKGLQGVQRQLVTTQNAAQRLGTRMMKTTGLMHSGLSRVGNILRSIPALISAAGVGFLAKGFFDVALQADSMRVALESALGGLNQAQAAEKFLREESDRLGLSFKTQIKGYIGLAAAARGSSLEGAATRNIYLGIAEASAALKLSSEESSGALRAINQIMSKGKVQAEELRGQLGERLPGAFQIAAKAMSMTTEQLSKQLELGNVYADDFLPKFAAALRQHYAGALDKSTNSAAANIARLSNAWYQFRLQVMDTNVFGVITRGFAKLAQEIKTLKKNGDFTKWVKLTADMMLGTFDVIVQGVGWVGRAFSGWKMIWNLLQTAFCKFGETLTKTLAAIFDKFAKVAEFFKMKETAADLNASAQALRGWAADAAAGVKVNMKELNDAIVGSEGIRVLQDKVGGFFDKLRADAKAAATTVAAETAKILNTPAKSNKDKPLSAETQRQKDKLLALIANEKFTASVAGLNKYQTRLKEINREYQAIIDKFPQLKTLADEWKSSVLANAEELKEKLKKTGSAWETINGNMAKSFEDGFANLFVNGLNNAGDAFKQWGNMLVESFARTTARMASDWLFFEQTTSGSKQMGGVVGGLFSAIGGMFATAHSGWRVGNEPAPEYRKVNPAIFNQAPRLHNGLAPDEFPAILQRGEEVIPKSGSRQNQAPALTVNVINQTDRAVESEASGPRFDGERWVVDVITRNVRRGGALRPLFQGQV